MIRKRDFFLVKEAANLKCLYYAIFKVANIILCVLKQVYMHPRPKNTWFFLKNLLQFDLISKWFLNDSCEAVQRISLSKLRLSLLWLVRWCSPLWLVYRVQREWQPWVDIIQMCYFVAYSCNRIRFKFLTTRLGVCEATIWQIKTVTLFIATWHTAWKVIFKKAY